MLIERLGHRGCESKAPDWASIRESTISDEHEREIALFVMAAVASNDVAHDWSHIERVVHNVKRISANVCFNYRVALAAAYLHDLIPRRAAATFESATDESAEACSRILQSCRYADQEIEEVKSCVRTGSWEYATKGGSPASLEAYILRDADLLEAMGAHGIARVFAFAGSTNKPIEWVPVDLKLPPRVSPNLERGDPTPFYHFFSKLLWLRDLFFTDIARQEAERRHQYLLAFLTEYLREREWPAQF